MALDLERLTKEDLDGLTRLLRINNSVLLANPDSNVWPFAENVQNYIRQEEGYDLPLGK